MSIKDLKPFANDGRNVSFRAIEELTPGEVVKLLSDGVKKADALQAYIGQVEWHDGYMGAHDRSTFATGAVVPVALIKSARRAIAGGAITQGNYVKLTTDGKVVTESATAKATATVGTVVFTAVTAGTEANSITVETVADVSAGSETAEVSGTAPDYAIVIHGNAASSIAQVQAAIAANDDVAALITADSLTTFAADGPDNLAGGTSVTTRTVNSVGVALTTSSTDGDAIDIALI